MREFLRVKWDKFGNFEHMQVEQGMVGSAKVVQFSEWCNKKEKYGGSEGRDCEKEAICKFMKGKSEDV